VQANSLVVAPSASRSRSSPCNSQHESFKTVFASGAGVLPDSNIHKLSGDSVVVQQQSKCIIATLGKGAPVSFRVESLAQVGEELQQFNDFIATTLCTGERVHLIV
jgi:hypothetical protein